MLRRTFNKLPWLLVAPYINSIDWDKYLVEKNKTANLAEEFGTTESVNTRLCELNDPEKPIHWYFRLDDDSDILYLHEEYKDVYVLRYTNDYDIKFPGRYQSGSSLPYEYTNTYDSYIITNEYEFQGEKYPGFRLCMRNPCIEVELKSLLRKNEENVKQA
jgi:hypothetical protein